LPIRTVSLLLQLRTKQIKVWKTLNSLSHTGLKKKNFVFCGTDHKEKKNEPTKGVEMGRGRLDQIGRGQTERGARKRGWCKTCGTNTWNKSMRNTPKKWVTKWGGTKASYDGVGRKGTRGGGTFGAPVLE